MTRELTRKMAAGMIKNSVDLAISSAIGDGGTKRARLPGFRMGDKLRWKKALFDILTDSFNSVRDENWAGYDRVIGQGSSILTGVRNAQASYARGELRRSLTRAANKLYVSSYQKTCYGFEPLLTADYVRFFDSSKAVRRYAPLHILDVELAVKAYRRYVMNDQGWVDLNTASRLAWDVVKKIRRAKRMERNLYGDTAPRQALQAV
jgi:hypothetical protein